MQNNSILSRRFAELATQLAAVSATRINTQNGFEVDSEIFTNCKTKARHLLALACGQDSIHFKDFVDKEKGGSYLTSHDTLMQVRAVFEAAQEDFDGGYMNSVRNMVQAEVFSNELDQANELMKGGYTAAAAVIAGVVLETTMRRMCDDAGIEAGSLNKMNADLTKASVYNLLVSKRITALADIRNSAAHGHTDKFTKSDVEDMLEKVGSFVADHMS
jgi:hypothetical protein